MSELQDFPLTERGTEPPAVAEPRPPRKTSLLMLVIAGLLLGGGLAWWWVSDRGIAPATVSAVSATEGVVTPAATSARALPPLGQMDIFLRTLLSALSASPEFARWLATDDLIRQMARGIDAVSRGQIPDVPVLTPQDSFVVAGDGNRLTIDETSYRRYVPLASLVNSMDPEAVARAYRTIQPRLDEAYRALGRSDSGVDAALQAALQVLLSTPTPRDPVKLVPGRGATYAYADPALEQLLPVQKQLMRMGPLNQAKVQTRFREIKAALDTSATR